MENPPKKYFRLFPGNEVRLMGAYFVKCVSFEKDENGNVTEIHCTYDPETKCGSGFTGRKVKGTIHWVAAQPYDSFQFVRQGFFCVDAKDSKPDALVFNRIVSLKSSFKLPKAE